MKIANLRNVKLGTAAVALVMSFGSLLFAQSAEERKAAQDLVEANPELARLWTAFAKADRDFQRAPINPAVGFDRFVDAKDAYYDAESKFLKAGAKAYEEGNSEQRKIYSHFEDLTNKTGGRDELFRFLDKISGGAEEQKEKAVATKQTAHLPSEENRPQSTKTEVAQTLVDEHSTKAASHSTQSATATSHPTHAATVINVVSVQDKTAASDIKPTIENLEREASIARTNLKIAKALRAEETPKMKLLSRTADHELAHAKSEQAKLDHKTELARSNGKTNAKTIAANLNSRRLAANAARTEVVEKAAISAENAQAKLGRRAMASVKNISAQVKASVKAFVRTPEAGAHSQNMQAHPQAPRK